MSLTLKIAANTSLVLEKARAIMNGFSFQKLGSSFAEATLCNVTQSVNKVNTARTRWAIRRPYPVTDVNGKTIGYKTAYLNIEASLESDCPFAVADEFPHLLRSIADEPQFLQHIKARITPQ